MELLELKDHQWETDLVELLGLAEATDTHAPSRAPKGAQLLPIYLVMLAGVSLVASISVLILSERRSTPETTVDNPAAVRRSVVAKNVVTLAARSSRLPSVFTHNAVKPAKLAEAPWLRRLSPADQKTHSTLLADTKPTTGPQPFVKLSAKRVGQTATSKPYAYAPEQVQRANAGVSVATGGTRVESGIAHAITPVTNRSAVVLPSLNVARSDLQGYHPAASEAPPAAVNLGKISSTGTTRQVALPVVELPIGLQKAGGSVQTPTSNASSGKVKAKEENRRTDAIDALRLLRRQ